MSEHSDTDTNRDYANSTHCDEFTSSVIHNLCDDLDAARAEVERLTKQNEKLRAQRDRNWGMLSSENKKKLADAARTEAATGD